MCGNDAAQKDRAVPRSGVLCHLSSASDIIYVPKRTSWCRLQRVQTVDSQHRVLPDPAPPYPQRLALTLFALVDLKPSFHSIVQIEMTRGIDVDLYIWKPGSID